ncbi:MAG: hypothetical protein ACK4NF_05855 [Planctomycetota bacterium]
MVVFCESCGVSLPGIDFMIVNGKEVAPLNFICPHCNKKATISTQPDNIKDEIIPDDKEITVVKEGTIEKKKID